MTSGWPWSEYQPMYRICTANAFCNKEKYSNRGLEYFVLTVKLLAL